MAVALAWLLLLGQDQAVLGQEQAAAKGSPSLQWGRPPVARPFVAAPKVAAPRLAHKTAGSKNKAPTRAPLARRQRTRIIRDAQVIAAAWDEVDAKDHAEGNTLGVRLTAGEARSVVVPRPAPAYEVVNADPFDDPFDEPAGESIPVPEPVDDISTVENAIEDEIERRQQSADDLLEDDLLDTEDDLLDQELQELLDKNPLAEDLSGEDEDLLQSDREKWKAPALDFDDDSDDDSDSGEEDDLLGDDDTPTPEELEEQRKELAQERLESEESCRQEILDDESDLITSIDLSIRIEGSAGKDYPYECAVSTETLQPRQWPEVTYHWKASCLSHKPLYFEQVQLERYGHSWGPYVQPIMSGAHFFGTLPILPYKMGIRTPNECVYSLGYYRPGSCAPYMIDPIPFTWRAAFFQGAAVTGISLVIP